jgi:hypothetical protein
MHAPVLSSVVIGSIFQISTCSFRDIKSFRDITMQVKWVEEMKIRV